MVQIRQALISVLDIINFLILVRVVVSWLPIGHNRFVELLYTLTEPILAPVRKLMSRSMSGRGVGLDFSPIIAFLLIRFLQSLIARITL